MKVKFKKSFARDLKKKANDRKLAEKVEQIIRLVDKADDVHRIPNLKKLKSPGSFYRIRSGDYRIGMIIDDGTVTFVRILHRSDIYRYFP